MKTLQYIFSEHEIFIMVKALHHLSPKLRHKPANKKLCEVLMKQFVEDLKALDKEHQKNFNQLPETEGNELCTTMA